MNVKQCLITLVLTLMLVNPAYCQDSLKYSTISLSIGLNNTANKDRFQSPYSYKGTNLLLNSSYARVNGKSQHIIDLTYSGGEIKSIVSPHANNNLILLNYDYLHSLNTKSITGKFSPSLGLGLHILMSNTNYLPDIESPKTYLSGGAYLTLSGNILYHLNQKSTLRLQFGLPVFGVVYRPDFDINAKTLIKTTAIGKANLFSARVQYDYKLSSRVYLTAAYNYCYFKFDEPRKINILQNALSIGLKRTF